MKEVILARTAGFCFGVERAIETVYGQINNSSKPIYTYGPIIHNEEVVADLEHKGVRVLEETGWTNQNNESEKGVLVLRSHGVSRAEQEYLEREGWECVDATCPFVKKIHKIVESESKIGKFIIIIGSQNHPEVQGIRGWVSSDSAVIETEEEAWNFTLPSDMPVCVVSQTTFNSNKFKYLVEILGKKGYNMNCVKTICNATEERQREARQIAGQVEAMIVIGGKHSSNTQKLYEICKQERADTYYIQTLGDLDIQGMQDYDRIGITAGASTPKKIIEEVQKECQKRILNSY